MLKDSQFSHILILLMLGYLIYYLTCPVEETSTVETPVVYDTTERFTAHDEEEETEDSIPVPMDNEEAEESVDAPVEKPMAKPIVQAPKPIVKPVAPIVKKAEPVDDESAVPEITDLSPEDIDSEEEVEVTQFAPNEEGEQGANLSNAFKRNIPEGADTNVVDFNKNVLNKYDSKSYLPQEVNDKWFDTDFTQAKFKMNNDKLINTDKYVIGVDTVGQSLKNATWDLRGTIANPKYSVSPWLNSTYEPDYNLKSLC